MIRRFALFLLLSGACFAARPVLLTTDCGADMDDQWAIAHLSLSPEFDLRAIVTTHTGKNPDLPAPMAESSARCARDVLAHMPPGARPAIIPGSNVPLTSRSPLRNAGVERILSESKGFSRDRRLTVLTIGAATDTASALLADPTLADRIEIIAMGFKSWTEGGDEFNIENDPIAWQVILDSVIPVTVGDKVVCKKDLVLTSERADAILNKTGEPGKYLAGLLDARLRAHPDDAKQEMGDAKVWPVWDEVTVAHMLGLTKSETRARPKLRSDLTFDHSASSGRIVWITAVQGERLWENLARKIMTAEKAAGKAASTR